MKIMKKKLLALGLACAALFAGHDAMATDLEITAQATIAQPITLTKDTANNYGTTGGNLSFGVITPGANAGMVNIFPTDRVGGWTMTKNLDIGLKGTYGPAFLTITGSPDTECSISYEANYIYIKNDLDQSKSLMMSMQHNNGSVVIDHSGKCLVPIGGSLIVNPDETAGSYTGTFMVYVFYD